MTKVFMRTEKKGILYFSYYDDDGKRWHQKTFEKIKKGPYSKLSLKQYDDIFGAKRWAEGNGYLIIDDAPMPHPEKLEGTPPESGHKRAKQAQKKPSKYDKIYDQAKQEMIDKDTAVNMLNHKCLVKYCRGKYIKQPKKAKDNALRCNKCGHTVDPFVLKTKIKKIDRK